MFIYMGVTIILAAILYPWIQRDIRKLRTTLNLSRVQMWMLVIAMLAILDFYIIWSGREFNLSDEMYGLFLGLVALALFSQYVGHISLRKNILPTMGIALIGFAIWGLMTAMLAWNAQAPEMNMGVFGVYTISMAIMIASITLLVGLVLYPPTQQQIARYGRRIGFG